VQVPRGLHEVISPTSKIATTERLDLLLPDNHRIKFISKDATDLYSCFLLAIFKSLPIFILSLASACCGFDEG